MNDKVRLFLLLVSGYVLLELLSWIGYNDPMWSSLFFFIVVLAVAVLAWFRPGLAVVVVLGELFVGSQGGYMLTVGPANVDGAILSLRMGLFLALFGPWLARTALGLLSLRGAERRSNPDEIAAVPRIKSGVPRNDKGLGWYYVMKETKLLWPYVALLMVFAFGGLRGLLAGNGFGNVFFDANGYAFFALFPAFMGGLRDLRARRLMWYVLAAAVTVSVAKALAVMYFFSHRLYYVAANMYLWVRDTRVGEVTLTVADFHRVFFQSHLYVLVAIFTVFLFAASAKSIRKPGFWIPFGLLVWGIIAMVLGLSRSFWFGGFIAALTMIGLLIWTKAGKGLWGRMAIVAPASLVLAIGIIAGIYAFPFPTKTGDLSFMSMLSGRAFSLAGEAAANSRWTLLKEMWPAGMEHPILGSGLGTTVTYRTEDPRLLVDNPTGEYTTFAFEWGYHDLWVKFGVLGLLVYAWLIAVILTPYFVSLKMWKRESGANRADAIVLIGIISGMVAMLATNVFSPYLNHPLGIGLLMAVAAIGYKRGD
ncbi:MAG: hypothetical protein U9Q03_03520 [Patescibacteria group bacterium]|nr:hypothetical protein [Patescibacteria group bacterium]